MRERDSQSMTLPPMRARRGRSFFERLRQKGISGGREAGAQQAGEAPQAAPQGAPVTGSYDSLEGAQPAAAISSDPTAAPVPAFPQGNVEGVDGGFEGHLEAPLEAGAELLVRGLELFNSSEYPRRVAGVSRSLGAPEVNVRSAEHLASVVVIVVAWELSWYRYEVDLSEDLPQVVAVAQGTELSELEREERVGNAAASEAGTLSLALAQH